MIDSVMQMAACGGGAERLGSVIPDFSHSRLKFDWSLLPQSAVLRSIVKGIECAALAVAFRYIWRLRAY